MPSSIKNIVNTIGYRHLLVGLTIILASFVAGVFISRQHAFNYVNTNVIIGDMRLMGKTYDQAGKMVENEYQKRLDQPIVIVFDGKEYRIPARELGIELDTFKTIEAVYDKSYKEGFVAGSANLFASIFQQEIDIKPIIFIDEEKMVGAVKKNIPKLKNVKKLKLSPYESPKADKNDLTKSLQNSLLNKKNARLKITAQLYGEMEYLGEEPEQQSYGSQIDQPVFEEEPIQEDRTNKRLKIYVEQPFTYMYKDGAEEKTFVVRFTRDWIDFESPDENDLYKKIKPEKLKTYLETKIATQINVPSQDAILKALPAEGSDYAQVEGVAKDGKTVDIDQAVAAFYQAIKDGGRSAQLSVQTVTGKIINQTEKDLGNLELLSVGKSNFAKSPAGRDFNVRKGLNEKVNSIMVAPGGTYNFNKNLGVVSNSAGWKNALAIFGGGRLAPAPGAGLCQVSTTVYRAALYAGLPIIERSPHSLYVTYYKMHGDGLDSTIFPGVKNLRFENNTGNWLLVQAYDQGSDAYVKIYGTSDGRSVDMSGPFYPKSIPEEFKDRIKLNRNQIGWWQVIKDVTGKVLTAQQLTGTYRSIPY